MCTVVMSLAVLLQVILRMCTASGKHCPTSIASYGPTMLRRPRRNQSLCNNPCDVNISLLLFRSAIEHVHDCASYPSASIHRQEAPAPAAGLTAAQLVVDVRHLEGTLLGGAAVKNQKLGILAALIKVRVLVSVGNHTGPCQSFVPIAAVFSLFVRQ